jgi:hypothetical protein
MNIFIFPTDDRSGLTSIIYHYSKLGHKIFVPKPGTLGLRWEKIATWPILLCKSSVDKNKRNLELYPFKESNIFFGEDFFLKTFKSSWLYDEDVSCEIIDLNEKNPGIDIFHTLRGGEESLLHYFKVANEYFPNAKWVSSTMNAWNHDPGNHGPKNVAKFAPANYESKHMNVNNVNVFCVPFEKELLDIDSEFNIVDSFQFASFNHNFEVRQPDDYIFFTKMNSFLKEKNINEVKNFGGNVRSAGADIRFSEKNGVTGKFLTISPRQSYKITKNLKAAVHFKQTDWGGGVFYYCLNSGIPIITTKRYVLSSNSSKYLIDQTNAIIVETPYQAAESIERILNDSSYQENLKSGMKEKNLQIFNNSYWEKWNNFIKEIL